MHFNGFFEEWWYYDAAALYLEIRVNRKKLDRESLWGKVQEMNVGVCKQVIDPCLHGKQGIAVKIISTAEIDESFAMNHAKLKELKKT